MAVSILKNGIPHDAIILTNSKTPQEFSASKIFSIINNPNYPYPWQIEIHLSGKCILNCNGCSYSTRHSNYLLSIEDINNIFLSAKKMNVHSIFFSGGGDPLYWDGWSELIKLKKDIIPNIMVGISTNLVSNIDCRFFNNFFDFIQIHLVGYDTYSCLSNTNVDCFKIINRQLSMLDCRSAVIKVLVNSANIKEIPQYLSFLENKQIKTIVLKFEQNFVKNDINNNFDACKQLLEIVMNHNIITNYNSVFCTKIDNNDSVKPSKCYVVDKHFYSLIRENGDVYPCIASTYSTKNVIGNIHSDKLEEMYIKFDNSSFSERMSTLCPTNACRHYKYNMEIEINKNHSSNLGESQIYLPDLI